VLDYDDLLLYWAQMVGDASMADDIGGRFDHVLVDEYQDTNRLQSSILLALKPGGRGLTVVGDDAQSIYSFRAATVRNILDFGNGLTRSSHVPTTDAMPFDCLLSSIVRRGMGIIRRHPPHGVSEVVRYQQSAGPIDRQTNRPSVRLIVRI
jgi:UvrD/REP helicase N-terminal domain